MFGLIIPVFNFATGLPRTFAALEAWRAQHPETPIRVCFVNDGSKDMSQAELARFTTQHAAWAEYINFPQNRGKGACIKAGFLALAERCPKILFTDCDLYYGLELILPALAELEHADIVILDRSLFGSYGKRSGYRNLASRLFNKFVCLLTGVSFFDTQAGFKAFRTELCLPIFKHLRIERFAFDVELLAYATRYLLRIHSLPVILQETRKREMQKSTINLATSFEVIFDILRIGRVVANNQDFDEELKAKLAARTHKV